MKKYRLIEYIPNRTFEEHPIGVYPSKEKLMEAMPMADNGRYYRVEEVEESIMDRVKSYEDACEVLNLPECENVDKYLEFGYCKDREYNLLDMPPHIEVLLKLETITAALNEGWKPDWMDDKQEKWYVYHEGVNKLKVDSCCEWSLMPSRFYFKSRELAEYAAKQFEELYKQLLIEKF